MRKISCATVLRKAFEWAVDAMFAACLLFAIYVLVQIFALCSFSVPSESMMPTIMPGDKILVAKISTGGRLLNIGKAAAGKKTAVKRMPGWQKFGRGDILVFNFVHKESWDTIVFNWQRYYVKRCLAIPGDTVEIRDFEYFVNSRPAEKRFRDAKEFLRFFPSDSAARANNLRGYMADANDTIDRWTIRDFGPLAIPAKGSTMALDKSNIHRYRQIIERETGKKITEKDGRLCLGGAPLAKHTFMENYYFMAGDNNISSMDSRYWGLVPESFIVGKASAVWWSKNSEGVQWNRIFKRLE